MRDIITLLEGVSQLAVMLTLWKWQYVFPGRDISIDPRSNIQKRHHINQLVINKAIKAAVKNWALLKE